MVVLEHPVGLPELSSPTVEAVRPVAVTAVLGPPCCFGPFTGRLLEPTPSRVGGGLFSGRCPLNKVTEVPPARDADGGPQPGELLPTVRQAPAHRRRPLQVADQFLDPSGGLVEFLPFDEGVDVREAESDQPGETIGRVVRAVCQRLADLPEPFVTLAHPLPPAGRSVLGERAGILPAAEQQITGALRQCWEHWRVDPAGQFQPGLHVVDQRRAQTALDGCPLPDGRVGQPHGVSSPAQKQPDLEQLR